MKPTRNEKNQEAERKIRGESSERMCVRWLPPPPLPLLSVAFRCHCPSSEAIASRCSGYGMPYARTPVYACVTLACYYYFYFYFYFRYFYSLRSLCTFRFCRRRRHRCRCFSFLFGYFSFSQLARTVAPIFVVIFYTSTNSTRYTDTHIYTHQSFLSFPSIPIRSLLSVAMCVRESLNPLARARYFFSTLIPLFALVRPRQSLLLFFFHSFSCVPWHVSSWSISLPSSSAAAASSSTLVYNYFHLFVCTMNSGVGIAPCVCECIFDVPEHNTHTHFKPATDGFIPGSIHIYRIFVLGT